MLRVDQGFSYENCWSGYKWDVYESHSIYSEEELGWFTSRIPIMDPTGKHEMLSIYTFDSEDYACADGINMPGHNCIGSNAISWYATQEIDWGH